MGGRRSHSVTPRSPSQNSVPPDHEPVVAPRPLGEAELSMASIQSAQSSDTVLEEHSAVEDPSGSSSAGSAVTENVIPLKRSRENSTSSLSDISSEADGLQTQEADAGPSTAYTNSITSRTGSIRDIVDVDMPSSTVTSSQRRRTPQEDIASGSPSSPIQVTSIQTPPNLNTSDRRPTVGPLSSYNCPICFSPPSFATLTPCGHICCAECLFSAVRSGTQRSVLLGPAAQQAK